MSDAAGEQADRYVRGGTPAFVAVYDAVLALVRRRGLGPGDLLPGEVTLVDELSADGQVERSLVREALQLLEEDGHLRRDRSGERRWRVAPEPAGPTRFTDSFHRLVSEDLVPVRRVLAGVEAGGRWARGALDGLGADDEVLVWETVFAVDDVLLASTLELLRLDRAPAELRDLGDPADHDLAAHPTLLEALGDERRAGLDVARWRLTPVSRATERLSWMDLPLHGIPAALTVVLAEDGVPTYLAKNVFDLATFDLDVRR